MSCEICASDSTADPIMWTCAGCPRKFHASCVGVVIQRGSLRKKDRAVDTLSYMIPCCTSCQNLVSNSLDFNTLATQQAELATQINKNTEVIHRINMENNNTGMIHETIDRLELLLNDLKKELMATRNSSTAATIKNHLTSLFDISIQASKESISPVQSTMTGISNELKSLSENVKQLGSLTLDVASNNTMQNNPILELDILNELRTLSEKINSMESKMHNTPAPANSLQGELNGYNQQTNDIRPTTVPGWRFLGNSKVWRADWTEHDEQQKLAVQARQRRRNQQLRNNHNTRRFPHSSQRNRNRGPSIVNTRDNNNNPRSSNFNYHHNNYNNHHNNYNNNIHNNNNKPWTPNLSYHHNNYNNNQGMLNFKGNRNSNNFLPPDRELLAAAKHQFSRPPSSYQPTMQFQRGETLNPYPTNEVNMAFPGCSSTPSVSCIACSGQHTCFRRN